MESTILQAMQVLASNKISYGARDSQTGEKQLQMALGDQLRELTSSDGWDWRYSGNKEERFATDALTNDRAIAIDLVGRHTTKGMVAIELKFVLVKENSRPDNAPGFPWDVAKDCLKLDLLRAGLCKRAPRGGPLPNRQRLQTYCIGMTNWAGFWNGRKTLGWATNFLAWMQAGGNWDGVIETLANDESIYFRKRHHIALGQPWKGEWKSYAEPFRYIFLRPDEEREPKWTHDRGRTIPEQSRIIPFLNSEARADWSLRHDAFNSEHELTKKLRS